jgi:N-methylhydantoinase B
MLTPIQIEVMWNRLLSVANEQQIALMRTAFSTIVRESLDLACAVFDSRGLMIAQSDTGTPGHINPMATGVPKLLKVYPPETLRPGDVIVTNDPWLTAGQINDFTVLTPVFKHERIVGYFANCCHAADIGGHVLSAEASEVYEEGLRVPVMKLFDRGAPTSLQVACAYKSPTVSSGVRTLARTICSSTSLGAPRSNSFMTGTRSPSS